jgi:hypothetical protein
MSGSGKDAPKDQPPRRILEIDLHGSPKVKILEEARLALEKREDLLREMEKHSGAFTLRGQLEQMERGSVLAHVREAGLHRFEEDSAMRTIREQFRDIEQSSAFSYAREAARLLEENSTIPRILEELKHNQAFTRTALGPMWELRQAGLFAEDAPWQRTAALARDAMTKYEARFRLPDQLESGLLAERFRVSAVAENLAIHHPGLADQGLQQAMEKMRTPWLDQQEAMRSVAGFAEIQRIGEAVRTMPAFDDSLAATLRESLGDWRDPIQWQPEIFTDLTARADFYVGLGFNPALTDFPPPAFEQGLEIAGLEAAPSESEPADSEEEDGEEAGLMRTNVAHDPLQRVERSLRRFIDKKLTRFCGPDWPKHRLPNGIYDRWQEKKHKAEEDGAEERPLIEYSDFTDYALIICRKDNWREVFSTFFRRQESVRETFQRLYPIRLDVAHARLITQDDEFFLRVEVKRLETAMCDA